MNQCSQCFVT